VCHGSDVLCLLRNGPQLEGLMR